MAKLTSQLEVATPARIVNLAGSACGLHSAARLGIVGAVAKRTGRGKRFDFREGLVHGRLRASLPGIVRPELQLTNSGIIQNQSAVGEKKQFAMGGGMATATIRFAARSIMTASTSWS